MVNEAREKASLLWLLALTVALFVIGHPAVLGALLVAQLTLWLGSTLPAKDLLQPLRRLIAFGLLIALSFAFLPAESGADRWVTLPGTTWPRINLTGLALAGTMLLRVLTLVLASALQHRTCPPGALVRGLRALYLPETVAIAVDATLAMLAGGPGSGAGAGTGGGMGGGRHRQDGAAEQQLGWQDIRGGRVQAFAEIFERGLARSRRWLAERNPELTPERLRDLSVVLALCLTVMGLKVLQVLPGIPFASGHKNVLIVPLFLYAAQATGMRWGGFAAGTAVGIVSFLLGYGKFGVLEIAHFAVPGLLADLLTPWLRATAPGARLAQYAAAGAVLGLGRFAANFLAILLAGAPGVAFALFAPLLISQVTFGALSCFVSVLLIKPKPASAPD
ncbi:MAG: CbiQ family ECF transporter T component, partial [Nevskiaceae bacterium]